MNSHSTLQPGAADSRQPASARRHDLDALRAFAMLLGIVLHAALSFYDVPIWPVHDVQQAEWMRGLVALVHGFRMPLFFLLSGFFTAMLWRKRGLSALIEHRVRRILLPCVVGLFTIIPAVWITSIGAAIVTSQSPRAESAAATTTAKDVAAEESDAEASVGDDGVDEMGVTEESAAKEDNPWQVDNPLWGLALLLMYFPVFHHLWFLWFLCWLVAGFVVYAAILDRTKWKGLPRWLVLSPARFAWLIPLTLIPQSFMGLLYPDFGPDTSTGLVPAPHILLYYAIFFGFGALYFDADDRDGRVGRWWPIVLPINLLIVFPAGFELAVGGLGLEQNWIPESAVRPVACILQVIYAWSMTFGMMGLFRQLLPHENKTLRYLSDSSYWLYLAHMPLIFIAQAVVRTWELPAVVKLVIISASVIAFLLFTYEYMVRYTIIGTFLNGPRYRRPRPVAAEAIPLATAVEVSDDVPVATAVEPDS